MKFDPVSICRTLNEEGVEYLVVGGFASVILGSPLPTEDIDVLPDRSKENLARLAMALRRMNAMIRTDGDPVAARIDADFLANMPFMLNLVTDFGIVDLTFEPSGPLHGFSEWNADATSEEVADGLVIRAGDAFRSGALVSFHNDGLVSPPIPLLNVQCMVTRRTPSGQLHGPEQQVSLQDAFKAHTINAAKQLGRENELGSLAVGKLADLVQLSADPFKVDVEKLTEQVTVEATWVNGAKVDTDAFLTYIESVDPSEHAHLPSEVVASHRC